MFIHFAVLTALHPSNYFFNGRFFYSGELLGNLKNSSENELLFVLYVQPQNDQGDIIATCHSGGRLRIFDIRRSTSGL